MKSVLLFSVLTALILGSQAFALKKIGGTKAFKGGTLSIGAGIALGSYDQEGLNQAIRNAKATSGATTGELNSSTEYLGFVTYRFANNLVSIQLRPAYFAQSVSGSGTGGSFDYSVTGMTLFPLIRFIPLSNDIIDFYIQGGLGYGKLDGKINNAGRKAEFTGSSFGTQVGIGADFCFLPEHCFGIEGNYRYLPIDRNKVTATGGVLPPDGISPVTTGKELENSSGDDLGTKLSGVSGVITYSYNF